MPLGRSSRKLANALAMPLCDALSVGDADCDALNVNPPRGPWLSCVCSSMSLLGRQSAPNLTVWLPHSFVSGRGELPRLLPAIPREAVDVAERRVA